MKHPYGKVSRDERGNIVVDYEDAPKACVVNSAFWETRLRGDLDRLFPARKGERLVRVVVDQQGLHAYFMSDEVAPLRARCSVCGERQSLTGSGGHLPERARRGVESMTGDRICPACKKGVLLEARHCDWCPECRFEGAADSPEEFQKQADAYREQQNPKMKKFCFVVHADLAEYDKKSASLRPVKIPDNQRSDLWIWVEAADAIDARYKVSNALEQIAKNAIGMSSGDVAPLLK